VLASVKALALSGRPREALETVRGAPASAHVLGYLPLEAEAHYYLGETQARNTQYREAESSLTEAVMLAEAGHHDEFAARASTELVHITGHALGKIDASLLWERYARAAIHRLGGSEELAALLAYNRASVLALQNKHKEALEALDEAVTRFERLLGPESHRLSAPLQGMGMVLTDMGRLKEAEAALSRALSIAQKTAGPEAPEVGSIYISLGNVSFSRGDFLRQSELTQQALRILEKTVPAKHFGIAVALQHLGFTHAELGQPRTAVEYSERALKLATEIKGPQHPTLEGVHRVYGQALASEGDFARALVQYQHALALHETVNQGSPDLGADLAGMGQAWLRLHRPLKALSLLERALRLELTAGARSLEIANAQFLLAQALWEVGKDKARARALATAAREAWLKNGLNPRRVAAIDAWLAAREKHPNALAGVALEKRN